MAWVEIIFSALIGATASVCFMNASAIRNLEKALINLELKGYYSNPPTGPIETENEETT
jgi:hypothetical protein